MPQVWAMLMYLDDVLGRLFDAVASSGLKDSTYIMLTADNGPGLPKAFMNDELQRLVRARAERFVRPHSLLEALVICTCTVCCAQSDTRHLCSAGRTACCTFKCGWPSLRPFL